MSAASRTPTFSTRPRWNVFALMLCASTTGCETIVGLEGYSFREKSELEQPDAGIDASEGGTAGTDSGEDDAAEACAPDCLGRECGSDGCGGTCAPGCGSAELCEESEGQCRCRFEACGSSCCASDEICRSGACCAPDCWGRECGSDGCGGSCPPGCNSGESCDAWTGECECVAESDAQLCARFGLICEMHQLVDNCGDARVVSCGACPTNTSCWEGHTCQSFSMTCGGKTCTAGILCYVHCSGNPICSGGAPEPVYDCNGNSVCWDNCIAPYLPATWPDGSIGCCYTDHRFPCVVNGENNCCNVPGHCS